MTRRQRATTSAKVAVAGVIFAGGALATAGQAAADPGDPAPPAPGQPVVVVDDGPVVDPAPPPVGMPTVPEIPNASYGSGNRGGGFLGSIRDAYNQAKDPYGLYGTADPMSASPVGAPPGAGPAPALPPGYVSITAPGSETVAAPVGPEQAGPALPDGYYPITGPPPPGYDDPAAQPVVEQIPPTP